MPITVAPNPNPNFSHWEQVGDQTPQLSLACPTWRDDVKFIYSNPPDETREALTAITAELKSCTDDSQRVVLAFFQGVMRRVLGES